MVGEVGYPLGEFAFIARLRWARLRCDEDSSEEAGDPQGASSCAGTRCEPKRRVEV